MDEILYKTITLSEYEYYIVRQALLEMRNRLQADENFESVQDINTILADMREQPFKFGI